MIKKDWEAPFEEHFCHWYIYGTSQYQDSLDLLT
jgi:hypothetical protein